MTAVWLFAAASWLSCLAWFLSPPHSILFRFSVVLGLLCSTLLATLVAVVTSVLCYHLHVPATWVLVCLVEFQLEVFGDGVSLYSLLHHKEVM